MKLAKESYSSQVLIACMAAKTILIAILLAASAVTLLPTAAATCGGIVDANCDSPWRCDSQGNCERARCLVWVDGPTTVFVTHCNNP